MYRVKDEASEEVLFNTSSLLDAIDEIKNKKGLYIILDDYDNVVYYSNTNITYKI